MTIVVQARARRRRALVIPRSALVAGILIVAALSLSVGAVVISVPDIVGSLLGVGDAKTTFVVNNLRLPRVVMALIAGAAFGLAGALFQALFANPLASPDLIGITSGASASAVIAILVLGLSGFTVSLFAFVGGLGVAAIISVLAWKGGLAGQRFVLVGVALAFMVQAGLGFLLTRADVREAQSALVWMVGSIGGTRWVEVAVAATSIGLFVPLVVVLARRLAVLQVGDDAARALGLRVTRTRAWLIAAAVGLAAAATAAIGPVAFVAFVAAPIARRIASSAGAALLESALVGALLIATADFVAQHALPGGVQVPVGIVTGLIGAPYLLWLLASQRTGVQS